MPVMNRDEIRAGNLIQGAAANHYRATSYDISVGQIIMPETGETVTRLRLEPQGMVEVVSVETVTLPATVVGYAMVKTKLCAEGVLALNIGIVDPGYSGPLSSTIINFGRTPYLLESGDPFLRLVFHSCASPSDYKPQENMTREAYVRDKTDQVLAHFSSTFLNPRPHIQNYLRESRNAIIRWTALAGFVLALFALLATLGAQVPSRWLWGSLQIDLNESRTQISSRIQRVETQIDQFKNEHRDTDQRLDERVRSLEQQLVQISANRNRR